MPWTLGGRVAVPAGLALRTRRSSSRRPPPGRRSWGRPFTHWSTRKLAGYLAGNPVRTVMVGRERLRQLLRRNKISFQRTRTWKESCDPEREAKLDRIEQVTSSAPDRCFAFDQFGPLSIRPCHGSSWATQKQPTGCRRPTGAPTASATSTAATPWVTISCGASPAAAKAPHHSLSALRSIRAVRPDGEQLYVILDNLSTNKTPAIRRWAKRNKVELCFTPTSASWANPIEAQFGPLRSFVLGDSNHPNHAVLARKLQGYLRWRNANARDPEVLAAQRRERARVRSERQRQWGRPARRAA